jgi:FAS-associated factor 2
MSAPAIDISSLSADQQAALEQYTAVTNQEVEAAIPLLQRTQWNVQVSASLALYLLLL